MADSAAWRVGDIAAYDAMRDDAATLVALLLEAPRDTLSAALLDQAAEVQRMSIDVDGQRRQAVDDAAAQLRERINELGSHRE